MKKSINNRVQTRGGHVRDNGIDEDARTVRFTISTEAVDSYNTVFLSDGWSFDRYNRNPVVFYQHGSHSDDPDMLIGTARVFQEGKETIGEVTFEPAEDNALAEKVFRKVVNGTLRGASIGADIQKGRWGEKDAGEDPEVIYFERQELLEWSIVTIPSNPDALKRNAESIENIKKELNPSALTGETERDAMSMFDAQLIINQNL